MGGKAHNALKTIVEDDATLRGGEGFEDLVEILTRGDTIHRNDLPFEVGESLQEIGYVEERASGHVIYILGEDGEDVDRKFIASNVEKEIDRVVEKNLKSVQDSAIRIAWVILMSGFVLQAISYFVRHFVQ